MDALYFRKHAHACQLESTCNLLAHCVLFLGSLSATIEEWKQRTIYQLLTDRFAKTIDTSDNCTNLHDYCNGTFQGIINHIDYIQGMNFDAIWISPVVTNIAKVLFTYISLHKKIAIGIFHVELIKCCLRVIFQIQFFQNQKSKIKKGYHGYWAKNIFTVNSHYGNESDLITLGNILHSNDMYLMIDVVANHMGIPVSNNNNINYNWTQLYPFNESKYYHSCDICESDCQIHNFSNQIEEETCRLAGLPDLNQSVEFVNNTLLNWVKDYVVTRWQADGLRIDTVPEVHETFWPAFELFANVYVVGEVSNPSTSYVSFYQKYLDSTLSYPMFYTIRNVFGDGNSFEQLNNQI